MSVPVCTCGLWYPASSCTHAKARAQTPGFPSQHCLALGLLVIHHMILEAVFRKGSQSRR